MHHGGNTTRHVLHAWVLTKVLKLASPVFASMFRPGFQEGNSLQSQPQSGSGSRATDTSDLPVIHLYEDNPFAMEVLLNALHFRCHRITSKLEFPMLSDVAVLSDKYDCSRALKPWAELWLSGYLHSMQDLRFFGTGLGLVGLAAYLFRIPQAESTHLFTEIVRFLEPDFAACWAEVEKLDTYMDARIVRKFNQTKPFRCPSPLSLSPP